MVLRLRPRFDLCTGCLNCQLACSEHWTGGYNPRLSVLRIEHYPQDEVNEPVVCIQCENAYCAKVCPVKAISRNEDGVVVIDRERCIGCGHCAEACHFKVINLDTVVGKAVKCNLCQGEPACTAACPTGALINITAEEGGRAR